MIYDSFWNIAWDIAGKRKPALKVKHGRVGDGMKSVDCKPLASVSLETD